MNLKKENGNLKDALGHMNTDLEQMRLKYGPKIESKEFRQSLNFCFR